VGDFLKLGDKGIPKICALGDASPVLGSPCGGTPISHASEHNFKLGSFVPKEENMLFD
jgi:hypothetical protein